MDERLERIARYLSARTRAAEFNPASIGLKLLPHLFVLEIIRDSAKELAALRIRLVGTELDRIFRWPLKDHALEEFIHGPYGADVIATFHRCANTHEPVWMRQTVSIHDRPRRFVEGVVFYLAPERLYGGLVVGESADKEGPGQFERRSLRPDFVER
jgi:hypothetical protein